MNNFQVYKKTLCFSFADFFIGLLELAIVVGLCIGGYFIMNKTTDMALVGLAIGLLAGILVMIPMKIFINNRIKAGQIAMMTKGVVDGELPDHVYSAGLAEVKGRFGRITAFFIVTGAIKGMFRQIGRLMTRLGKAVGGKTGEGIASAVDTAVQIFVGFLCDCCLGWVMYHKEKGVTEAACEGAVVFFKHGKALIRNVGRIFGMGFLSLAIIGGGLFGIGYFVFTKFPQAFTNLANEIAELNVRHELDLPEFLTNPQTLIIAIAAILALILWSMIHSLLIRPFILVGVLRNFMDAGLKENITEEDMAELSKKSPKFAKLRKRTI